VCRSACTAASSPSSSTANRSTCSDDRHTVEPRCVYRGQWIPAPQAQRPHVSGRLRHGQRWLRRTSGNPVRPREAGPEPGSRLCSASRGTNVVPERPERFAYRRKLLSPTTKDPCSPYSSGVTCRRSRCARAAAPADRPRARLEHPAGIPDLVTTPMTLCRTRVSAPSRTSLLARRSGDADEAVLHQSGRWSCRLG
jgi:hypothetical protein